VYLLVIALLSLLFAGETVSADSCASIDDGAKRLECYDQMFPPKAAADPGVGTESELHDKAVSNTSTTSTISTSVQEPAEQSSPAPEQTTASTTTRVEKSTRSEADRGWGIDSIFNRRETEVIESSIAALRRRETQNMIFLLANDQVWLQDVPRSIDTFQTGDKVTIKSGTLGGYFMTSANGTTTRVRRIK
jgi:hypothetical protein